MALFGRKKNRDDDPPPPTIPKEPQDPKWARTSDGTFHRMAFLEPEAEGLGGKSGVYVIWHGGVRPGWVILGRTNNLASTLESLGEEKDVTYYEINGGLFVTWSMVRENLQDGVVLYLQKILRPLLDTPSPPRKNAVPVPVIPPAVGGGRKPER